MGEEKGMECAVKGCRRKSDSAVEKGWLCSIHRAEDIKKENSFPYFLHKKIDECVDIERAQYGIEGNPPGVFMLRELAQNADDSEAEILVIEFKPDGLYIFNDGRAFTQKDKKGRDYNDFHRLVNILTRPKALDPDSIGSYGSGFQTVYYVTNTPEVHSFSNHLRYDPTKEEGKMVTSCEEEIPINPPYDDNGKIYGGTIFRLPWRGPDDHALGLDEEQIDTSPLAKWDRRSISFMFEQFKLYSHDLILCANHLKIFRILWNFDKKNQSNRRIEGYQVQKGDDSGYWDLNFIDNDGKILNVVEGEGHGRFRMTEWDYKKTVKNQYIICSDFIKHGNRIEFITKPKGKSYEICHRKIPKGNLETIRKKYEEYKSETNAIKRSEIHVLIPLQRRSQNYPPPTYCTIPLAKRGGNWFVISGPFFSKENRAEIKAHTEAEGVWFRDVVKQIVNLYVRGYSLFIEKMNERLKEEEVGHKDIQDLILFNLPSGKVEDWIGAEGVLDTVDDEFTEELQQSLYQGIFHERIYLHDEKLVELIKKDGEKNAYFTDKTHMGTILKLMGYSVLDERFFKSDRLKDDGLRMFVEWLENDIVIEDKEFIDLYNDFIESESEGQAIYDKDKKINEQFINDMIMYWQKESHHEDKDEIPIFPNRNGGLIPYNNLRRAPRRNYECLNEVLPDDITLHPDFVVSSLMKKFNEVEKTKEGVALLIKGIDEHHQELEARVYDELITIISTAYKWIEESGIDLQDVINMMNKDFSSNPKFILDYKNTLLPVGAVGWLPYKHYNEMARLLIGKEWKMSFIHGTILKKYENYFKKYLKWLEYPKIIDKLKEEIEGLDEEHRKRQTIFIEGILDGLIEHKWESEDIQEISFLPVLGLLKRPRDVCIGIVLEEDIKEFLGVLDDDTQNIIKSSETWKKALTATGMGDINDASKKMEWICNKIDEFGQEGKYYLGEDESLPPDKHGLTTKCLCMIDWTKYEHGTIDFPYGKKILPVRYNDNIYLENPPRQVKGMTDTGDIKEAYRQKFIFSKGDLKKIHPLIQKSIRLLDLGGNIRKEEEIAEALNIMPLVDKSGQRRERLFMMHFVVPNKGMPEHEETSLFFDEGIEKLIVGSITPKEKEDMKINLVPMVLELYRRETHTGQDYEASNKPCLCRKKERGFEWYCPKDAILGIHDDVLRLKIIKPNLDILQGFVNGDFDIELALTNMGIPIEIGFDKVQKVIEDLLDSGDELDRRLLLEILHLSLSMRIGNVNNWEGREWFPVSDNGLMAPQKVLVPTKRIKEILGTHTISSLLDVGSGDLEFEFDEKAYDNIGMRTIMDYSEILEVWKTRQEAGDEDCEILFEEIRRKIKEFSISELNGLNYFHKGKWYAPEHVFIMGSESIPSIFKEGDMLFLEERTEDDEIIGRLREASKTGPPVISVDGILKKLSTIQDYEAAKELWEYLVQKNEELTDKHKQSYNKSKLFPYEEKKYAPASVILSHTGERKSLSLNYEGCFGEWFSIPKSWDSKAKSHKWYFQSNGIDIRTTLERLGSKTYEENLHIWENIKSIMTAMLDEYKENRDEGLRKDYLILFLLLIDARRDLGELVNNEIVPIIDRITNHLDFYPFKRIFIKDEGGIWTHFSDKRRVHILDPSTLLEFQDEVEQKVPRYKPLSRKNAADYLISQGANEFMIGEGGTVQVIGEPDLNSSKQLTDVGINVDIAQIIDDLINPIDLHFPGDYHKELTNFKERNSQIPIYVTDNIKFEYILNMSGVDGGDPIKIPFENDILPKKFHIFIRKDIESIESTLRNHFIEELRNLLGVKGDAYKETLFDLLCKRVQIREEDSRFMDRLPSYINIDFNYNLNKLEEWWTEHLSSLDESTLPTLEGDFWWTTLGLDELEKENDNDREAILRERIFIDRKLMFSIFSMATLFGANVQRTQIRRFIEILRKKGLSFNQIYDMEDEAVLKRMIENIFKGIDSQTMEEKHYPNLRRRMFDILILRWAFKDENIGQNIIEMIKVHMVDGLSPEQFLTSGRGYGARPFMKGFKGMFTGQIYFIVREIVRLGQADNWRSISSEKWKDIAFHAPSQVRKLIWNLGGEIPTGDGWREELAKNMTQIIKKHENLNEWYDIPFFIYCDEFCRRCMRGNPPEGCELNCYQRW